MHTNVLVENPESSSPSGRTEVCLGGHQTEYFVVGRIKLTQVGYQWPVCLNTVINIVVTFNLLKPSGNFTYDQV
jgi:hypothetical protein